MTRRIVAIGKKRAGFSTLTMKVSTRAGAPEWVPQLPPEPDHDLIRKQEIEDQIAKGDEL